MLVVQLQLFLGIGRLISNPPGDNRTPIAKRIKNVENQSKLEIIKLRRVKASSVDLKHILDSVSLLMAMSPFTYGNLTPLGPL